MKRGHSAPRQLSRVDVTAGPGFGPGTYTLLTYTGSLVDEDGLTLGLVAGYDFGFAQVSAAVRYSPNFFANSGEAWYKWGQIAVPLPILKVNENVSFKAFGTLGNQYVERFTNYGIPNDNYWDWQLGLVVSVYGIDLSAASIRTATELAAAAGVRNIRFLAADLRDYGIGAQMLRAIGIRKMKLMSNNPKKRTGLIGYGLEIIENIPLEIESNIHNERYLETKRDKAGHTIKLDH